LTGYVLYEDRARGARRCCEYWVEKAYPPCQISYEPYVRVFTALSRAVVPLRALARVCFYDEAPTGGHHIWTPCAPTTSKTC
ncbi:MAG: hypothetical protein DRJ56_08960, partial [Thermoprotei archaeon]